MDKKRILRFVGFKTLEVIGFILFILLTHHIGSYMSNDCLGNTELCKDNSLGYNILITIEGVFFLIVIGMISMIIGYCLLRWIKWNWEISR